MTRMRSRIVAAGLLAAGLAGAAATAAPPRPLASFSATLKFLLGHTDICVLRLAGGAAGGAAVAVAPAWAGRVMVSTWDAARGPALGWINRDAARGKRDPQFVNFGGAERLWISPEGGQWSTFFAPGSPFEFKAWRVPHAFNDEPFIVRERDARHVVMEKDVDLVNRLGTTLRLKLVRRVRILEDIELYPLLGRALPRGVKFAGYRTDNAVVNRGPSPLTRETGLVSIWILSMFVPSERTVVLAPIDPAGTGPAVIDDYFGKVPASRLGVDLERGLVVFKADGRARGKIGLPAARARDVVGSMDFSNGILTIMKFSRTGQGDWLRNTWATHDDPFGGDVVNGYNDGPPGPGLPALGGFYELENLSPAKPLAPGERLEHWSVVLHFNGPVKALNELSRPVLGADLTKLPKL